MWGFRNRSTEIIQLNQVLTQSFRKVKQDVYHVHEWIQFLNKQNEYQQRILEDIARKTITKNQVRSIVHHELNNQITNVKKELREEFRKDLEYTKTTLKSSLRRELQQDPQWEAVAKRLHTISERLAHTQALQHRVLALEQRPNQNQEIFERLDVINKQLQERPTREELNTIKERMDEVVKPTMPQLPVQPQQVYVQPEQPFTRLQKKVLKRVQRNSKEYVKTVMLGAIKRYERLNGLQLKEMVVDEQGLVAKSSLYRLLNELVDEGRVNVQQDGKEKIYSYAQDYEENPKV